jgi:hypothetical protein
LITTSSSDGGGGGVFSLPVSDTSIFLGIAGHTVVDGVGGLFAFFLRGGILLQCTREFKFIVNTQFL